MQIPTEWLTQQAENAPVSYAGNQPDMMALRIRMAWQKLKSQAREGDQLWAWTNPSSTWKKRGKLVGYALVREGQVVVSVEVEHA